VGNDELDRRLAAAGDRLAGLSRSLELGAPWALASRFDHSPEASWGPPEILAHLAEMQSYWLAEAERILDASGQVESFGRTATNDLRLAIIERDRTLPLPELEARVRDGIDHWRRRWAEFDPADRGRSAVHVTLGRMTVSDLATRLVVGHLEGHLDQLAGALALRPADENGSDGAGPGANGAHP
jgi:hypothetical protein